MLFDLLSLNSIHIILTPISRKLSTMTFNATPTFTPPPKERRDSSSSKLSLFKHSLVLKATKFLEVLDKIDLTNCPSGSYIVRQLEEEFISESQDKRKRDLEILFG